MSELKACPFCGERLSDDIDKNGVPIYHHRKAKDGSKCLFTRFSLGWGAEKGWDTRPIEDALNKRIAELETERDQAKNELADIRKMVTVSKNYSELWEEREWLSNKLTYAERCIDEGNARIAKIIAERDEARTMVERLIEAGDELVEGCELNWKHNHIPDCMPANNWNNIVNEWREREK